MRAKSTRVRVRMDARAAGTSRRARRRSRKKTQQPLLKLREEQRSRGTSECTAENVHELKKGACSFVCRGTHAQCEQGVDARDATLPINRMERRRKRKRRKGF
ncbi:hypothetical protein NQZ68_019463 [Dissostichus eleginoides]|nr:hypothetical protein NQZ68_019463 [Dissostichus eleginoides]